MCFKLISVIKLHLYSLPWIITLTYYSLYSAQVNSNDTNIILYFTVFCLSHGIRCLSCWDFYRNLITSQHWNYTMLLVKQTKRDTLGNYINMQAPRERKRDTMALYGIYVVYWVNWISTAQYLLAQQSSCLYPLLDNAMIAHP